MATENERQKKKESEQETYKVYVECNNCGYGNNDGIVKKFGDTFEEIFLTIPKGKTFEEYKQDIHCHNCGCKGTFEKK